MGAQSRVRVTVESEEQATSTATGAPTRRLKHSISVDRSMPSGTGSEQSDVPYSAELTVTDVAQLVDVRALVSKLTGGALLMAEVTGILVKNMSSTTGEYFYVDSGGANPLSGAFKAAGDGVPVGPLGEFLLTSPVDGFASDATHKTLQFTAAAGKTITAEIWLLGRSA